MQSSPFQRGRIALVVALALGTLASVPVACSSPGDSSSSGDSCEGGIVKDGKCVGKCTTDKCIDQNTCVDNECKLLCDTHLDCNGDQRCAPAKADYMVDAAGKVADSGGSDQVQVCQPSGKAPGFGASCPLGNECDAQFACPDGSACDPAAAGSDAGGGCAAADCKPLTCRSSGTGDAEAYCSLIDCHADTDCADGFDCAVVHDPHKICGKNKPAQNGVDPCVDPANFMANGQTFQEGPTTLLRNACVKRRQCAPCESDLDCSRNATPDANGNFAPAERCVDVGGTKSCSRDCGTDKDCDGDYKCDTGHCIPRFGKCTSGGQYTFCAPCNNDLDCGGTASNTKVCAGLTGDQRACIDVSFPDKCTTSADCPTSPGGKHGYCLDEGLGVAPGDAVYHHCYFPQNGSTMKITCW